ncbi:MAG: heavy metal-binding domain-containing protein, partial [Hyphomicrobiaceae bacterium]
MHDHNDAACCGSAADTAPLAITAVDPVCGMVVDSAISRHVVTQENKSVWFCSAGCQARFEADPEKYAGGPPSSEPMSPEQLPDGTQYTCPMDPEIVRDEPGTCPICGMALEPMGVPDFDAGPNPELLDFTRRFWIGAALAIPLLLVAMGPMLGLPVREWLGHGWAAWLELILATPIVLWCGRPFFERGWTSIRTGNLNMWTLIAIGVGVAYVFSAIATLAPGVFPAAFRNANG